MKKNLILAAILVGLTAPGLAQTQEQLAPSMPAPDNSRTSGVDEQGIKNYLLGPGDVLDVRVFGQPDLNAMVEIDSDGNISSLPFLEVPLPARCRTEKEVQKEVAKAYAKYLKNPQVSVRISERKSRMPATVFGAVRQPARIQMQRRVRLNELMVVSGGFTERASGTIQIVHTEPVMCPLPGEEADAAPLDSVTAALQIVKIAELKAGKPKANPYIRPGDVVTVTEAEPVYVIGSVMNPTGIYKLDQLTLSRALAMVGGARKEAKLDDVIVTRQKPGETGQEILHVDYAAIKKNQKPDFFLQAYDVIEVREASPFSGTRIVGTMLGAVTGSIGQVFSTGGSAMANKVIY